ncbi:MAG: glycosyltransferase [candidate division Zixibacteria bacterium]|nr:glycosyltransferase [candidate division Zixibacteria bacterium]
MKIGFDGRFIRQGQTGNGVFTQLLLEGLARLDDENEYTVYLLEDKLLIQKDNFRLKRMPFLHASSHLRFLLTFPLELWRNPVDIFHAIYTIPLRTSARVVLTLVEFSWLINPEEFPASPLFLSQLRLMTRHSIHRADRIITPTWVGRNELLSYFDLPEEKVEVIHFGFNDVFLEPCEREEIDRIKQRYGIASHYLLSVGDLHPRKNLIRLIEAFSWLKETQRISHQLVLVGKDLWRAEEIYRKASSCSARDSIVFTGYIPIEELKALYQGATLFAFPSLNEGFGLPVHEAMASRLPVIVSDRGALPEVAGNAALVVDPLNVEEIGWAIFRVLDSPTLRKELVRKGLEQIQAFSWEESCRKTLRLYQNVCSTGCEERRRR